MEKKNKKAGVIYTCITGGYDKLRSHTHTNPNWDYVCFTDDLSMENPSWEIRSLFFDKLDNVRKQRWHKLHPHMLFPEYEKSIWIDANINVLKKTQRKVLQIAFIKSILMNKLLEL